MRGEKKKGVSAWGDDEESELRGGVKVRRRHEGLRGREKLEGWREAYLARSSRGSAPRAHHSLRRSNPLNMRRKQHQFGHALYWERCYARWYLVIKDEDHIILEGLT